MRLAINVGHERHTMSFARKLVVVGVIGTVLNGCYAYAGPPRHTYHPRRERVVVVERAPPAPVVVHERVVVRERRHRDYR